MKAALAIENFSRYGGGAESYAVQLADTLVRAGWEVHLYGHSWDGEPEKAIFHEIKRLPKWVPPSIRVIDFALRHRSMVSSEDFDVILGFGNTITMNVYQSHGGVHALSTKRKLHAIENPLVRVLKHATALLSLKYHARAWIESAPFRLNPRPTIIAISHMVRDDIASYFHMAPSDIRLVYNGIDLNRFGSPNSPGRSEFRRRLGFGDEEILFLFMAYDFRKKGVRYLIESAGLLQQKIGPGKFGLVIAGNQPTPELTRLVEKLGLSEAVRFPGPTKEPEAFYGACDVFVLPTFYDACSLVVFEAMASGLPAITTSWNGAAGIITDRADGAVLQKAGDVDELADAMEFFLDSASLREASASARETAQAYSLTENHRKMLQIFDETALEANLTE
jgi:UDP-glucose:(heptosyl)LPS alpha-1,3-glucosyltransferase